LPFCFFNLKMVVNLREFGQGMLVKLRNDLILKLRPIKLLLINADGFVSKSISDSYVGNPGIKNGFQISSLKKLGVLSLALSTKMSEEINSIVNGLGIEAFHQGIDEKLKFYSRIQSKYSVLTNNIAYICYDLSDLNLIDGVNFSVATYDAPLEVKAKSNYVTYGCGEDAVREVADLILKAKSVPQSK